MLSGSLPASRSEARTLRTTAVEQLARLAISISVASRSRSSSNSIRACLREAHPSGPCPALSMTSSRLQRRHSHFPPRLDQPSGRFGALPDSKETDMSQLEQRQLRERLLLGLRGVAAFLVLLFVSAMASFAPSL